MVGFTTGLDEKKRPDSAMRKKMQQKIKLEAAAGNPKGMFELLYKGFFLDGLVNWLRSSFQSLSNDEIDDVVSQSILILYEKLRLGESIYEPYAYLRKTARNLSIKKYDENMLVNGLKNYHKSNMIQDDANYLNQRDKLKSEALSIAKSFLPKLGQHNVQLVMEYIFDAIERNVDDVSNREIADALSLSVDVVKQSKSRGFRRLKRTAESEGYHLDFDYTNKLNAINHQDDEGDNNE